MTRVLALLSLCLFFGLSLALETDILESDAGNVTETTEKPTEKPSEKPSERPSETTTTEVASTTQPSSSSSSSETTTTDTPSSSSEPEFVTVKNTVIKGTTTLDMTGVDDPEAFASDPDVKKGVANGIATSLNVPAEYVDVVLTVVQNEASYRRLQASSILVTYTITIPEDDANAENYASAEEVQSQMAALASGEAAAGGLSLETLAAAIVSKIQESKPDLQIEVTVSGVSAPTKETVTVTVTTTSSSSTSSTSSSVDDVMGSAKTPVALAGAHLIAFFAVLFTLA